MRPSVGITFINFASAASPVRLAAELDDGPDGAGAYTLQLDHLPRTPSPTFPPPAPSTVRRNFTATDSPLPSSPRWDLGPPLSFFGQADWKPGGPDSDQGSFDRTDIEHPQRSCKTSGST
ncbi:hypothetical protein V8E36_002106 [Tilletia maclaganii]